MIKASVSKEHSEDALLKHRIELLFTCDAEGRLVGVNEPWDPDNRNAPLAYVCWGRRTMVHSWRQDLPSAIVNGISTVMRGLGAVPELKDRSLERSIYRLFPDSIKARVVHAGPAYRFVGAAAMPPDVIQISRSNVELLEKGFDELQKQIEVVQPLMVRRVDGHVASTCLTVRKTGTYLEAGVETIPNHRRFGYGTEVVTAWACRARQMGLVPLYSTSWDNTASIALAKKLGLVQYGTEFSISLLLPDGVT